MFTDEEINNMKVQIVTILEDTKREGIKDLIKWMDDNGFFTAPCSTQYHLSCAGGLAQHSINVLTTLRSMAKAICAADEIPAWETMSIVALLHDLGKCGIFGKPNYVENWIKDGRPTKAEPEQKYKISESKPYKTNPDLLYLPHAIRSVEIASKFIELTEEEEFAIATHDGLYGEMKYVIQGHETPLYLLLHSADLWCSRVVEAEGEGEADE